MRVRATHPRASSPRARGLGGGGGRRGKVGYIARPHPCPRGVRPSWSGELRIQMYRGPRPGVRIVMGLPGSVPAWPRWSANDSLELSSLVGNVAEMISPGPKRAVVCSIGRRPAMCGGLAPGGRVGNRRRSHPNGWSVWRHARTRHGDQTTGRRPRDRDNAEAAAAFSRWVGGDRRARGDCVTRERQPAARRAGIRGHAVGRPATPRPSRGPATDRFFYLEGAAAPPTADRAHSDCRPGPGGRRAGDRPPARNGGSPPTNHPGRRISIRTGVPNDSVRPFLARSP